MRDFQGINEKVGERNRENMKRILSKSQKSFLTQFINGTTPEVNIMEWIYFEIMKSSKSES